MPATVTCPSCQTSYKLPEQFSGKKVRCRKCQTEFAVAADAAADEDRLNVEAVDEIDSAESRPAKAPRTAEGNGRRSSESAPQKSNTLLYALLGGGAFLLLLLCGGCGGVGYYFFVYLPRKGVEYVQERAEHFEEIAKEGQERALEQQRDMQREAMERAGGPNNPNNPPPNNPPDAGTGRSGRQPRRSTGQYANTDEVLADLKPGDVFRCRAAIDWLARNKIEPQRQAEVAQKLEALLDDQQVRDSAAKALAIYATKENVPGLIRVLDSNSVGLRETVIYTLGKLKDERAAAPLATRLKDFFDRGHAGKALIALGPVAEKDVVKYAFDQDRGVQTEARKVLASYNTKDTVLVTQALDELKGADNPRKQQAEEWLEKATVSDTQQKDVAKALEPLLSDNDGRTRELAFRAMKTWASKESVPSLLKYLDSQDGGVRKRTLEILGNLKDERAVTPVALRLTNFFDREAAANALIAMGPIAEKKEVINGLANKDAAVRKEVCRILGAVGTRKTSVPILKELLLAEKNTDVRAAAEIAIRSIDARLGK